MKKILLYSIYLSLILSMSSCSDFLELAPPDKPSEATFWKTKSDFELALNGCYGGLQEERLSALLISYDCMTDNAYRGVGSGNYENERYVTGLLNPSDNGGHVTEIYKQSYKAIARINNFLYQLENATGTGITEEEKKNMVAEAHFLRGYCYWMLHLFYGEVPIVKEPLTIENQIQPKNTLAEVKAHVLSDFQTAIDNFTKDQTYKEAGGRATKGAARGMKARVIMFYAYDAQGNAIQAELEKAYSELNQISGYTLNPEYAYNFYPDQQENSPEIMFSIKFMAPSSYHVADRYFGQDNGTYPTTDLFNAYYPGDTRRLKTFAEQQTYTWIGRPTITFATSTTNYGYRRPIKGVSPLPLASGATEWGKENMADYDPVVLRWGELMLLKAEIAVEMDKFDEARQAVNDIRDRQTTLAHLPENLSKTQMRDSVRHERRVETAYESALRYYDLKRWGIMEQRLKEAFNNDPDFNNLNPTWTAEKNYFLPLPQNEIEKSRGVLIQNPAYSTL